MRRPRIGRTALIAAILAMPLTAAAQDEMPAIGGMPQKAAAAPSGAVREPGAGTTIIGERESPIGLYIMPWRESRPEKQMDRPARLLQEKLLPLDEDVFVRQIEYHQALSGALRQKGLVTPGGR
ncbi:hypothetical protein AAG565_01115 [Fontimonas sp. SYSU GA230001]|uniref:hypothetical protein n=1 Tax=Fontimonas sp. SYSU GA230001 TaxID=3142450 RepID=UPI0032B55CC9